MNQLKPMGMQTSNPMPMGMKPMTAPAAAPMARPAMPPGQTPLNNASMGYAPGQAMPGGSGGAPAAPTYRNPLSGAVAPGPMSGGMHNAPGAPAPQPGFMQKIMEAIRARRSAANPRTWNTAVLPEGAEQFQPMSGLDAISQMPFAKPLLDQFSIK